MENVLLAVPSSGPGGMDAEVNAHFGHCDVYTIVKIEDGKITDTKVIPSLPHGDCLAPVKFLADQGVKALISGGMGMRPLSGFQQNGIDVFHGQGKNSVSEAVNALIAGELPVFPAAAACTGCGDH